MTSTDDFSFENTRVRPRYSWPEVAHLLRVEPGVALSRLFREQPCATDDLVSFADLTAAHLRLWTLAPDLTVELLRSRLEFNDRGQATVFYPFADFSCQLNSPKPIRVDPTRRFGGVVTSNNFLPLSAVDGYFRAGDSIEFLAENFNVSSQEVEHLIRWLCVESRPLFTDRHED